MNNTITPEDGRRTVSAAWSVVNNLVAGILLYGGIGWLLGVWLGHPTEFLAIGAVIGMALGMVLVYFRLRQLDGDLPSAVDKKERGA